jgi:hypothetical protein
LKKGQKRRNPTSPILYSLKYKATDLVVPRGTQFELKLTLADGRVETHPVFSYAETGGVLMVFFSFQK